MKKFKNISLTIGIVLFLISLIANYMYSNKVWKLKNELREKEIEMIMNEPQSLGGMMLEKFDIIKEKFTD